ncbi:MAG: YicC family protein [Ignavibacteria bacterium GWF2_33_9]|nr:MAG: YicC family protein [Ignavibacteria bacterium GWF2_33_9]
MLVSMTGFSRSEYQKDNLKATVEIKSVNGKNLEIYCRLPRNMQHLEMIIRELIKNKVSRGSINVNINFENLDLSKTLMFNQDKAIAVMESLKELKNSLKIKDSIKLDQLMKFSEFFTESEDEGDEKLELHVIRQLMNQALINLNKMRMNEGKNIEKDIFNRVKKIQKIVDKVRALGLDKIPQEREKFRQKVAQLFEGDEIDEQRMYLEMVLLADKLDISEECVRLESHFNLFYNSLKEKDSVGRKINFLLQEMNREINTIGSKANDSEISSLVITVKEEIERIREQIQNIE